MCREASSSGGTLVDATAFEDEANDRGAAHLPAPRFSFAQQCLRNPGVWSTLEVNPVAHALMPRKRAAPDSLTGLLQASSRPAYAVDADRRIVYCNPALAEWLDLKSNQIVGRLVEYHSEPADEATRPSASSAALTDLCPPPRALAGEPCAGTISRASRGGGLAHRRAQFLPLGGDDDLQGVLVLLEGADLSSEEVAAQLSPTSSADELHRTIRRFRRAEAARYSLAGLLGGSSAMRKVRAQVAAAADSGANTLIMGPPGSGRGHVARAIHYQATGDANVRLVQLNGELANDHLLERALDAITAPGGDPRHKATLLLESADLLSSAHQSEVVAAINRPGFAAWVIATIGPPSRGVTGAVESDEAAEGDEEQPLGSRPLLPALADAVSTIAICVPPLSERAEDIPLLAQFFLEACNRGGEKQVGSIRSDALDRLALHSWPGELTELAEAIRSAHQVSRAHEILASDLPAVVNHALNARTRPQRPTERVVLDELLASIEREVIERAIAQARGNKSTAAELLGMTRPRLYRRLVQLGLAGPEFVEEISPDSSQ